jgi:hypothetical protein
VLPRAALHVSLPRMHALPGLLASSIGAIAWTTQVDPLQVSEPAFLEVFTKFKDTKGKQAKLKSPDELATFLEAVKTVDRILAENTRDSDLSSSDVAEYADGDVAKVSVKMGDIVDAKLQTTSSSDERTAGGSGGGEGGSQRGKHVLGTTKTSQLLKIVRTVLEQGNHFSGINRKVQLKPTRTDALGRVSEVQLIAKWGGVLTHLGRRQAEELGYIYRMVMYPRSADGGGLLRLHSTYRHDLKIYSSDEGRVQTSAAAFIKGLLDLEGTSLVRVAVVQCTCG